VRLEELEKRLAPAWFFVNTQLQVTRLDSIGDSPAGNRSIVFFESAVADYQVLRQGLAEGTDAVLLDSGGDGLSEMAAFLANRHDVSAIGVVAHGSPGAVALGTMTFNAASVAACGADLGVVSAALALGGELDLWSCNVAAGEEGAALAHALATVTGAKVAAATHAVGDAVPGASWQLDVRVGGARGEVPFTAAATDAFDGILGSWSTAGALATARSNQTATLLPSGKVLVTGGLTSVSSTSVGYLASAELYDPVSSSWSSAGAMASARYQQTATLLPSGKVLVVGGADNNFNPLASAELYDPASNTWAGAPSMASARDQQTATLLQTGKLLVVGGMGVDSGGNDLVLASAELYDPATNTWSAAAALTTARYAQTATLLSNGNVLVAGGFDATGKVLTSAELYDPGSNSWSPAGSMATGRALDTATLLPGGKVLVAGGINDSSVPLASAELYDPAANAWSAAGSLAAARDQHAASLIGNGTVLVTGGADIATNPLAATEVYDPVSNTWAPGVAMSTARANHSAIVLQSGKVLIAGGFGPDITHFVANAALYDPNGVVSSNATQLVVTNLGATTVASGGTVAVTLTAEDSSGSPAPGYTGTVQITSTDSAATINGTPLPFSYTFVPSDSGTHTFTVVLATAGNQTIAATDAVNHFNASTSTIAVTPGAFAKFAVSVLNSSTLVAGDSFLVTAQAVDQFGNAVTSYSGPTSITLAATPADPQGNFPITATLNSSGFAYFLGNLKKAGSYTFTATAGSFSGTSGTFRIAPAAANYFTVAAPSAAVTGNPFKVTVTAQDIYGNVVTGYAGRIHFTSTAASASLPPDSTLNGDAFVTPGVGAFNVTLNTPGTQTITATDNASVSPTITGTSGPLAVRGLTVSSFTPTATGFTVAFSKPFAPADLALYGSGLKLVPSVTLVGAHVGTISGSLIIDPSNNAVTFNATDNFLLLSNNFVSAALPDDTYTATLVSGTSGGFHDALGTVLDGANDGGHANYTTTFTTKYLANATPVLAVPDFARGPGNNPIKVPNDSGHGIPVTLYNAANVSDVAFTVSYNPSLLTVSGALGGAGSDATAGTFTLVGAPTLIDNTHATANFHFQSSTPQKGTVVLGDLVAAVPTSAAGSYKAKELLGLGAIVINNGGVTGAVAAAGVHVNAYLGDVTGNGTIDGLDVATALTVAQGASSGFAAYRLLDPAVVGDVANDFSVDAGSVSTLAGFVSRLPTPVIPALPTGLTIAPAGPDPTLSLGTPQRQGNTSKLGQGDSGAPAGLPGSASAGRVITVPVVLDEPRPAGSGGMTEAILALTYDPSVLSVSPPDITLGSIPAAGAGWQLVSTIDPATGRIGIELFSTTPIVANFAGSLVNIAFHVSASTLAGATAVQLVSSLTIGGQFFSTQVDDGQGQFVVHPGVNRVLVGLLTPHDLGYPPLLLRNTAFPPHFRRRHGEG
jgi:N-acetylneuraminic acid mutarotase